MITNKDKYNIIFKYNNILGRSVFDDVAAAAVSCHTARAVNNFGEFNGKFEKEYF